jgi:hypothetical protein
MKRLHRRGVIAFAAGLAITATEPGAPASAQEPFAIPDNTKAKCVVFNYNKKAYDGQNVGDRFTFTDSSLWKGGSAVCDASGSWVMTWPHQDGPQKGCLLIGQTGSAAPGYNWFAPNTGSVYSIASSIKCRTDGRWQLVKGWK